MGDGLKFRIYQKIQYIMSYKGQKIVKVHDRQLPEVTQYMQEEGVLSVNRADYLFSYHMRQIMMTYI